MAVMATKQILVVKLSSMGDLFHALPAVHALRNGLDAEVDWVTQPEYAPLVRCFPDIRDVIPFPRRGAVMGLPGYWRAVRRRRYDLVIDLQGLLKSVLAARMAIAGKVIGPSFCREGSRYLYDAVAGPPNRNRHAVDEALDIVRHFGLPMGEAVFPVQFPPVTPLTGRPRVGIIPASRWPNKSWPVEYYAEISHLLMHQEGVAIHLFGSEQERGASVAIQHAVEAGHACSRVVNLAGRTGMAELGGWLKAMDLVIANDSGPAHMAAAAGTPVLALFGPTDPVRTGPYGRRNRVVQADLACRPCLGRQCRREIPDCMRTIRPETVYQVAREMLGGGRQ